MRKYLSLFLALCMLAITLIPVQAAGEIIIDNTDSGFSYVDAQAGDWRTSGGLKGYNDSSTMYCNNAGSTATWTPKLEKGTYKVSIYKVHHEQYACVQNYEISHNGKKDYVAIDFGQAPSGFVEIGQLAFSGTGDEYITLAKLKTESNASRADAVKFEKISDDLKADTLIKELVTEPFELTTTPGTPTEPTPPADPDPEGTVILNYPDTDKVGGWKDSGLKGYDGGGTIYADSDTSAQITWNITQKGYYKLAVYKVAHSTSAMQYYKVTSADPQQTVGVNFSEEPSSWMTTQTFYFNGDNNKVVLDFEGAKAGQVLRVSAIKLLPSDQAAYEADKLERETIKVIIDGDRLDFDQPPALINDRTMVPLRKIFETLGATIDWSDETQTVTASKEDTVITLTIDDTKATVNGETILLDSPATLVNDRTLVPVRFISEAMGGQVNWNGLTNTVLITSAESLSKNFAISPYDFDELGTWSISSQEGAFNSIILAGQGKEALEEDPNYKPQNASKKINVKIPGTYKVWVRSRDYATNQPGTRYFNVSVNGTQLDKTFGQHGKEGYQWEDAGTVELAAGENLIELLDSSCFYARCNAIFITGDTELTPPATYEEMMAYVPSAKGNFNMTFPAYAKELPDAQASFSIGNGSNETIFYTVNTSGGPVIQKETKVDGRTVTGREQSLGYILMYANESKVLSMAYQYPLWQQKYQYNNEDYTVTTQDIYNTGIPYWMIPSQAEQLSDTSAKLTYTGEKADIEAVWAYEEGQQDPKVSVTIKAKDQGHFSVGLASGVETPLVQTDFFVSPMIFVGKKMPADALLTYERFCPAPLSIKTLKNTNGETVTVGVAVDGDSITDKWLKENWNEDTYATGIKGTDGGVMPSIFAPVMGTDRANLKPGDEISISYRQIENFGDWYPAYTHIITDYFNFSDYRKNYTASLNEAIFNTTELAMDDYASGWDNDMKGHYNREFSNMVTHSNPLIYLERYLLTEDENLLEKRTVPTIEFMLTRNGFHFSNGLQANGGYSAIGKPSSYSTSVFGGAYEMTEGLTDSLKAVGLDGGVRFSNSYGQIPEFVEQLWYYNYTKDSSYLEKAKAGADRWIELNIDKPLTGLPSSDTFILVSFFPYFQGVLDLYETTKEQKYLDAAQKAGQLLITTLWAGPNADPNQEMNLSADAFREDHFRKGIVGSADMYNYEKLRFGYPDKLDDLQDVTVPFWVVSRAGLGMEQNFTYVMHRNANISMSNWAPDLMRLAKYTDDPVLEAFARSGVIGRHTNYSGYYYNQYSTYQMDPRYPYEGPDVSGLYYHHIPPFLAMLEDFLISQAWAWSDMQIDFPYVRNQNYCYFTNRQYGFASGQFFDQDDMWLWIKDGLVTTDTVQADWIAVRKDGKAGVAFMNEDDQEITVTATLGEDFGTVNTTAKVYQGNQDTVEIKDNKVTLTIPGRSLVAISFDAQVKKPAFAEIEPTLTTGTQTSAADGKVTGTVIQLTPDEYFSYIYTTSTPEEIKKATLKYKIGDGQWQTETTEEYPFEFTVKVTDPQAPFTFTLTQTDAGGKDTTTKEMTLKAK